jgi:hypothetical protein
VQIDRRIALRAPVKGIQELYGLAQAERCTEAQGGADPLDGEVDTGVEIVQDGRDRASVIVHGGISGVVPPARKARPGRKLVDLAQEVGREATGATAASRSALPLEVLAAEAEDQGSEQQQRDEVRDRHEGVQRIGNQPD